MTIGRGDSTKNSVSAPVGASSSAERERDELAAYFKYPALGGLFEQADPAALTRLRRRFQTINSDLQRIVRQGTQAEAARAAAVSRALEITLDLFDQLEQMQRGDRTSA